MATPTNDLESIQNNKRDAWEEFFTWRMTSRDVTGTLGMWVAEWVLKLIAIAIVAAIWYFIP